MKEIESRFRWRFCLCAAVCLSGIPAADARAAGEAPVQASVDPVSQAKRHLGWGYRYFRNKQYEDAESQFKKAWALNARSGRAAYYLGRLYNDTERYEEGVVWFNRSIELLPRSSKNLRNAYYFLAQIHVMLEDPEAAIQAYESLLALSPTQEKEIQYLHSLVTLNVELENFVAALEHAQRWGELDPGNAEVQEMVGKLHLRTGGDEEAIAQLEKVVEMNPEDFETLDELAEMYRDRGMHQKAFDAYEKLHKQTPENFLYLDHLLRLGTTLGKPKQFRRQILYKMLDVQEDNLNVIEQLADETGSLAMVNRGLKLQPGNGKLNYMKGEHYYNRWKAGASRQDSVQALRWFERAKRDPQWRGNAQRMIDEIDPPLTEEEKKLREFFKKTKKEEIDIKGKK